MIEPRCLIGLIDSRDSFQDGFAAPRKGFAGIQWSSALERPELGNQFSTILGYFCVHGDSDRPCRKKGDGSA